MTNNKQPVKLSNNEIKYLLDLLDKAQEKVEAASQEEGNGNSDDKGAIVLTRRKIIRIRLKLVDLYKK